MYNFAGIYYRLWAVFGFFLAGSIVLALIEKPWKEKFTLKKYRYAIVCILCTAIVGTEYISIITSPDIRSYSGEFINEKRNSRVAPPLPFTKEYVFWDGEGLKNVYYLDVFSKREIYPNPFVKGEEYLIYYEEKSKIIVSVEKIERMD